MLPPTPQTNRPPAANRDRHPGTFEAPVARILATGGARRNRAEQIIAAGRLALAGFSLAAVWLDPAEPVRYPAIAYSLLVAYLVYALLASGLVFLGLATGRLWAWSSHSVDLAMFFFIVYFTEGPSSPFFASFVFALVGATLRWSWRGTAATTAVLLPLYLGLGFAWSDSAGFELGRFVVRGGYLTVVAGLLAYLGAHEGQLRVDVVRLLRQPAEFSMQQSKVIAEMLTQAAELFRAPRALLLWEEDEEPWLCTGYWSADGVAFDKLPPSAFAPPVATELEHLSFSSRSVEAARPTTLARTARGVMRLRGPLLHAELRRRFPMRSVLSAPVSAPGFRGRLFVIDGRNTRADDLVLCEIFVRQLSVHLAQVELLRRMQRSAEADARTQLGRELHDGVVQSLTVAALRLEAAQHQLPPDSPLRGQLAEVEQLLGDEQEEMRRFIRDYRPRSGVHAMSLVPLPERVEDLRRRIASHWGLRVEVVCSPDAERIPGAVAHEIYRIAQESLVNAARHGEASAAQVEISSDGDRARLVVADNGHGFAFRGRYDLSALNERKLGPLMLKQRVASMSGNLVIESTSAGARLEIDLPMSRTEELA